MPTQANQYVLDPRQAKFLEAYLTPDSPTYSNAYQSGLRAGYSESYCKVLVNHVNWPSERISKELVTKEEIIGGIKEIATARKHKPSDRLRGYELLGKYKKLWSDNAAHIDNLTIALGKPETPAVTDNVIDVKPLANE